MTSEYTEIRTLQGKTPLAIRYNDDAIVFKLNDHEYFAFYHEQDCCESVTVEDVVGDFQDLVGNPLEIIEERTESGDNDDYDCYTWTYYTFRGIGGTVDVRWYGASNGYYSESVDYGMYTKGVYDYYREREYVVKELFSEDFE